MVKIKKHAKLVCIVLAALIVVFSSVGIVRPGNVGVLVTFGSVSDNIKSEGLYFKLPLVQSVRQIDVRARSVEWLKAENAITAMSKDLQDLYIQAVVTFHPSSDKAAYIYKTLGTDFQGSIVAPLASNAIKSYAVKYSAFDIIQYRDKLTSEINESLRSQLAKFNIVLDFISIDNIDFRPEFKKAIEQKLIAEKEVETQKFTLEKQAIEAQQQVKKAEADKQSKILAAEAEEEFNKKVSGSITEGLLKYQALQAQFKAIEKWNGSYPQVVGGNQSLPMIQLPEQQKAEK